MNETIQKQVEEIVAEARNLILKRLEEKGIHHDSNTMDAIHFDDSNERKSFYIELNIYECDEYGGYIFDTNR